MRRQGCKIDVAWSTDSCVRISSVEFWVACFFHSYFFQKHLFVFHHFLPKISQSLYKTHATKAQTSKMHAILADLHDRQQSAPQFPSVLLTIDRHDLHMLVWVTLASFVGFHMFFQERKPAKVREQETDGQGRADWEYCVRLVTSGFGALFFQHYYLTIFNPSASFLKFADIYIFWLLTMLLVLSFVLLSASSWDLESVELNPKLCKWRAGCREGLAFSQNGITLSPCQKGWRNMMNSWHMFFKREKERELWVWTCWQNFQVFAVWRTFIEQRKRHQHQEDSELLAIRASDP